ncbi:glycosyltransferase family 4 protein [Corynebacterium pygosceleis]|uniref:Glycosyltransferase family 4 protein n=1 Tax=Corynebacterium pygosceleis TaxID=2800406 RepID=A0A9Q4GIR5_9CORY|nr:glycosyltransferase family 4 protein [Corynebacterium pygosceleis]MCK7636621.1 glycosyltransferase family 4 protein [Corynebacterium pygosceleis]MCK7675195.1 glycosyltransferase family 4 protein [Corynebacterium pygosceleis]MCL0120590.1 glycosyltransferase family 4 protein [Corynebacterium pygosceleis]MCX7444141.1 glycosyltransferase family 4 protein [Corynebacterium pygosceleis]MCX7467374.1 glycosyltransferase family 4 protein [Corynebacterium pygosceleis]
MTRTLLVTNDFPPTLGGIQSYLRDYVDTLAPEDVVVFASTQDAAAAAAHDAGVTYRVYRWGRAVMLPTPATAREMSRIIRREKIDTVWFGAAAPLGLLAPAARRAGASRIVASTHGHEVGWSMLPGARRALRRIGTHCDHITYISGYTLGRFRKAFGRDVAFSPLPSGVDTELFRPASAERIRETRDEFSVPVGAPLIVCISRLVPRKGQDQLIRALPGILSRHPDVRLLIVGEGGYRRRLSAMIPEESADNVRLTGKLEFDAMRRLLAAADVFAMPCRTRGGGLDVEGLGIVYLEAQASGVPVIAGDSGGAPETVTPETGIVVGGRDTIALTDAVNRLLDDADLRERMGVAGRRHVLERWTWDIMGARLRSVLAGTASV